MFKHQYIVVLFISLFVSACGFHLRGNIPLPESLNVLFVDTVAGSFKTKLEQRLQAAGATFVDSAAAAKGHLKIGNVQVEREVGTLDERGKANSYTLILSISYKLINNSGQIAREATLKERRQYNFDPERVVESESEERDLLEDMETDIVLRMIRQLSALVNYPEVKTDTLPTKP